MRHYILEEAVKKTGANQSTKGKGQQKEKKQQQKNYTG
jgi:hypothetical protein